MLVDLKTTSKYHHYLRKNMSKPVKIIIISIVSYFALAGCIAFGIVIANFGNDDTSSSTESTTPTPKSDTTPTPTPDSRYTAGERIYLSELSDYLDVELTREAEISGLESGYATCNAIDDVGLEIVGSDYFIAELSSVSGLSEDVTAKMILLSIQYLCPEYMDELENLLDTGTGA